MAKLVPGVREVGFEGLQILRGQTRKRGQEVGKLTEATPFHGHGTQLSHRLLALHEYEPLATMDHAVDVLGEILSDFADRGMRWHIGNLPLKS
jgi:hypothetical protein